MNKFSLLTTILFLITTNCSVNAAINFTDFSQQPIQPGNTADAFENFQQGYRMSQEARRMQAEQQQLELQNKILEEQLKIMKKRG